MAAAAALASDDPLDLMQQVAAARASGGATIAAGAGGDDPLTLMQGVASGSIKSAPAASPSNNLPRGALTGPLANYGAGANSVLTSTLGVPVDFVSHELSAATPQLAKSGPGTGADFLHFWRTPTLPANWTQTHGPVPSVAPTQPVGGSASLNSALGVIGANPNNVIASSPLDRIARGAGAGTMAMLVPVGGVPQTGLDLARLAGIGTAAGAGGGIAAENVPTPYKPLANVAGQLAGGGAAAGIDALASATARAAGSIGTRLAAPFTEGGRTQIAAGRLQNAATNPATAAAVTGDVLSRPPLVPGSLPTLGQASGDPGLLALERTQATKYPDLFRARQAQQQEGQVSALNQIQPTGNPGAFGDFVRNQLDAMDAAHNQTVNAALVRAGGLNAGLGGQLAPQDYGTVIRGALADAKQQAKVAESRLWRAIDPNGTLTVDAQPTIDAARSIAHGVPMLARPMSGEESEIFNTAKTMPPVVPFGEFSALRSRVLDAIRNERFTNGDTPALRRLQVLRSALDNTIASAGMSAEAAPGAAAAGAPSLVGAMQSPGIVPGVGQSVYTPSGDQIGARYEVVEGNSLIPSHTQDLTENPAFASELQPRERSRMASNAQISQMAANLQPERLGPSASAAEGAPIVGPDNMVESGNARTLAIMRAYQQGGAPAQAYRGYLRGQGFNVEGMENPVLIRRRLTELTPDQRIRFAQQANAAPGLALSATERAAVDASRLTPDLVDLYKGGDVTAAENRDFVRGFARNVLDRGEEGSFVTPDGRLSVDGVRRVENALLSKAYGNSDLVAALSETGDENIRAFGNALKDASGAIAKLNNDIEAGRVPADFSASGPLVEAAQVVQRARATHTPLADLVAQTDAFNRLSPMAEDFLRAAYGPDLTGRLNRIKFGQVLRYYADEAAKVSSEAQLFASNVTPRAIIAQGLKRNGGTLFDLTEPSQVVAQSPQRPGSGIGAGGARAYGPGYDAARSRSSTRESAAGRSATIPLGQESVAANFGTDNAAAYRAAANATRERVGTFNRGSVGKVLRRGETAASWRLPDSGVGAAFFNKGKTAAEDIQGFTNAARGNPETENALREYAALDLRRAAARPDGTLDPAKVQKWVGEHREALQAFPDLAARFSDAAEAQRAVDNAVADRADALKAQQRYAATKFIGADPTNAFGAALRSKYPAGEMAKLSRWAALDKSGDATAGLRRAAVEYMQGRFLTEAVGNPSIRAQQFQTFLRQNRAALQPILGSERMSVMDNIAADLRRTNPVRAKLPGPGTAQDLTSVRRAAAEAGEGHGGNLLAYAIGVGLEHGTGSLFGGVLGAVGVKVAQAAHAAGLRTADDLVTEGLLNPEVGRLLMQKVTRANAYSISTRLISQLQKLSVAVPVATGMRRAS